jgi:hypothetical protein
MLVGPQSPALGNSMMERQIKRPITTPADFVVTKGILACRRYQTDRNEQRKAIRNKPSLSHLATPAE